MKSSLYYTEYNFSTYDFNKIEEEVDTSIINRQYIAGYYSSDIADVGFKSYRFTLRITLDPMKII